jgi:cytochrome P450
VTLIQHPDHVDLMLQQPGYLTKVIDELLRHWSIPQDNFVRVCVKDTSLGGVRMRPQEGVIIAASAANHDESVFADAATFNPGRVTHGHLSFGHGPHYCAGASLTALFTRLRGLRLATDIDALSFRYDTVAYGVNRLPVTW